MTSTDECRPNRTEKAETAVNFVKPKPNRKPQFFFAKLNRKPNEVIFYQPHTASHLVYCCC